MLTELDVVNDCLATMGELPINSIANSTNPMVTNARMAFQRANVSEQGPGWWFNTEYVKLHPQTDGFYFVPADTLSLYTKDNFNPGWLTLRGRKLYDAGNGEYFKGAGEIRVKIIRMLPFEDLPFNAQRLVSASAVSKFQSNYDGGQQKEALADDDYKEAYALCMMDHTNSVKANMLNQGGTGADRVRVKIPYRTGRRFR